MKQSKEKRSVIIAVFIGTILILTLMIFIESGISGITTFVAPEYTNFSSVVKIVREKTSAVGNALFDVTILVPEKSKVVGPDDDVLLSIELRNFGDPGKINITFTYIVTDDRGKVKLIQHEDREIETQGSFLKTLDPPTLKRGTHTIFVEMLYSNTSAVGTDTFRVAPWNSVPWK